jgi:alkylation response protein AidB-like acyl-CoA dehydrogenase
MLDRRVGDVVADAVQGRPQLTGYALPTKLLIQLARQYGRQDDPDIRQQLARYYTATQINRWTALRYRNAPAQRFPADGSLTKLLTSSICVASRDLMFSILGSVGMLGDIDAPEGGSLLRCTLGSFGSRIGGGTDEIQHNLLAERALGLPREPG